MLSLAGGLPDATRFPREELAEISHRVMTARSAEALQYGPTAGHASSRQALRLLFDDPLLPDNIVVTSGSQQGLDLVTRVLVDPGDVVVVSDPDYLGALQVFQGCGAQLAPISIDADGLKTDQLESELQWGLRPKACYLVPHFHNPTGATMTAERRAHLNELASRYGFVIIEDDPYRMLRYDGLASSEHLGDPQLTVRLRSTSKVLAPGLRVGALTGPKWLLDAAVTAKQAVDLHTSGLTQAIAAEALRAPWFSDHLDMLRRTYVCKRDVLVDALRDEFSTVEFTVPMGGMFVWARFPDVADTTAWLQRCLGIGVCFVPGKAFVVAGPLDSYARLSFATASDTDLRVAIDRMKSAV